MGVTAQWSGSLAQLRARPRVWANASRDTKGFGFLMLGYALIFGTALDWSGVRLTLLPLWIGAGVDLGCVLGAYALAAETSNWWRRRAGRGS